MSAYRRGVCPKCRRVVTVDAGGLVRPHMVNGEYHQMYFALGVADSEYYASRAAARALGRRGGLKGGKARAAALSAERRTEIAKQGARARWKSSPQTQETGGEQ